MTYRKCVLVWIASLGALASALAGEIALPEYHIAVSLPDGWHQVSDQNTGVLVHGEADSGRLRFIFTRPPFPTDQKPVQDATFQNGVKRALSDKGFSKIVRSEVIKVSGFNAYLCEAAREDGPLSVIQVVWSYEGRPFSLVFVSVAKPFKEVPAVQTIIDSVRKLKAD